MGHILPIARERRSLILSLPQELHMPKTSIFLVFFPVLIGLWGCAKDQGQVEFDDTRIDHGDDWDPEPRSNDPRLCVSGSYVYAVWWDDREGTDSVFLSVSADAGSHWPDEPLRVNHNPQLEFAARHPALACHEQEVFVVWEDDRLSDIEAPGIYYNFSQDGGATWQSEDISLSTNDGNWSSLSPQIHLSCAGTDPVVCARLSVAWYDSRNGAYDVYFNHSANYGFNWMAQGEVRVDVGASDSHSGKPQLAVDGAGGVYLAWEDRRNGTTDIYYNRSTDWGDTWGATDLRIDTDSDTAAADSFINGVVVSGSRVYIVWSDLRNGVGKDVYIAVSSDSGASFLPPMRLDGSDGPGVSDSLFPVISALGDKVWVSWRDDRYGAYDVLLQQSGDGGVTWLPDPIRVETGEVGTAQTKDPLLAVDETGRVVVAFPDLRNGYDDLFFNYSLDGGTTFSTEDKRIDADAEGSAISESLQMVMEGDAVYFLWLDWRFGDADVLFRTFPVEPVPAAGP